MAEAGSIHGTCVVVGEAGILIRGASGSGKSTLAREILDTARQDGLFAALVSDDRVRLGNWHGNLIAGVVTPIAGLIEARGVGLLAAPFEPRAVVRLVVDLSDDPVDRLPHDPTIVLCGVLVHRLGQPRGARIGRLVLSVLSTIAATGWKVHVVPVTRS